MKNFRKVLALILVVATLFSFTAMASAAEYKDADDISADYDVAVEVLSAIGILNGYTDGTFQPTKNIQREEMAKMVAVLSNAGDEISSLYASACTFADSKDSWAASYIAYCNQTGIVAGRSATTFDPDANVTGLETAKMLLCVLGFDAAEQGYVGSNWKVNVLRDAKNFGLLNGFAADYDVSKAITREEAAQMFLNALQAPLVVGTLSNNVIKLSNALYIDGSKSIVGIDRLNLTLKDAEKFGEVWTVLYGNVVVSWTPLASIYKGLSLRETRDCYGRPGYVWSYDNAKGVNVMTKYFPKTADLTYTTTASLATDLKQEATSTTKDYTLTLFVDGKLTTGYTLGTLSDLQVALTGKGVRTEVYVDDAAETVDVVIINTYIDEVVSVNYKKNTFTLSNDAEYSNKGHDFAIGDVVLYWTCNDHGNVGPKTNYEPTLHDAELAVPVTATVTRVTTYQGIEEYSTLVGDGKTYEYAYNFGETIDPNEALKVMDPDDVGKSYDLYLDEYGYVMYYKLHVEYPEVHYAYGIENSNEETLVKVVNGEPVWSRTADLVDFDAKLTEDVPTDGAIYDALYERYHDESDDAAFEKGALIAYTVNNGVAYLVEGGLATRVAGQLNAKSGKITLADGSEIWGTSNTKYLIRTWDYANGTYKYTAVTGKANLEASYVGKLYENGVVKGTLQYFDDGNGFATYVFVDALYAASSNYAYILGYTQSVSDVTFVSQIGAYDAYDAIVNGEAAYVFDTINPDGNRSAIETGLYKSELEVIGLTDEGTPVYATTTALASIGAVEVKWNGDVLYYETEAGRVAWDAEDTTIVLVFPADYDFKVLENNAELNKYASVYGWTVLNAWTAQPGYLYVEVG